MRELLTSLVHPNRQQVFLHIGAMKTGTTYVQQLMEANRASLGEAGVLFPGRTWADQTDAARDVLGASAEEWEDENEPPGLWRTTAQQMLAHPGRSVFSMEFLSFANDEQATRVLEPLADAEVHVILTVRDAAKAVPAQWQTSCRMAGVVDFPNLVEAMGRKPTARGPAVRLLQRTQGIPRMLEVWTPLVGPQRTHVVTVPPRGSDPTLLWQRFASIVGIDPQTCAAPSSYVHTSLGHASSELLRRINIELGPRARSPEVRVVKRALVRGLLPRAGTETPIVLDRRGRELAVKWNRRSREAIEKHRVRLVGSLDDLALTPPDGDVPKVLPVPSNGELLATAGAARACLLRERSRLQSRAGERPDSTGAEPAPAPLADLDEAVREVTDLLVTCLPLASSARR